MDQSFFGPRKSVANCCYVVKVALLGIVCLEKCTPTTLFFVPVRIKRGSKFPVPLMRLKTSTVTKLYNEKHHKVITILKVAQFVLILSDDVRRNCFNFEIHS